MVKDKVTKDDLMKFAVGDQKVFTMPNYNKARSAQSYANAGSSRPSSVIPSKARWLVVSQSHVWHNGQNAES